MRIERFNYSEFVFQPASTHSGLYALLFGNPRGKSYAWAIEIKPAVYQVDLETTYHWKDLISSDNTTVGMEWKQGFVVEWSSFGWSPIGSLKHLVGKLLHDRISS